MSAVWILATTLSLALTSAATLMIGRRLEPKAKILVWDLPRVSATYTTIVGSLSGFAVASSIFIANLLDNRNIPEFESVIGLFLMGFILLVGTAMMFGTIPNHPAIGRGRSQPGSSQWVMYVLANTNYYLGISLTWFGLRPLLLAVNLPMLASIFTWILLFVTVAGAFRIGMFAYRLTRFGRPVALLIPGISFGVASLYRLVLVPLVPGLWPAESPWLAFAVVVFVLAAIGFSASTILIQGVSSRASPSGTRRKREDWLLAFVQAASCSVAFLWWAVANP